MTTTEILARLITIGQIQRLDTNSPRDCSWLKGDRIDQDPLYAVQGAFLELMLDIAADEVHARQLMVTLTHAFPGAFEQVDQEA